MCVPFVWHFLALPYLCKKHMKILQLDALYFFIAHSCLLGLAWIMFCVCPCRNLFGCLLSMQSVPYAILYPRWFSTKKEQGMQTTALSVKTEGLIPWQHCCLHAKMLKISEWKDEGYLIPTETSVKFMTGLCHGSKTTTSNGQETLLQQAAVEHITKLKTHHSRKSRNVTLLTTAFCLSLIQILATD